MRYFLTISALLLTVCGPAFAQQGEAGALSYTTLGARKEREGGHMNYKALKYNGTLEKSDPKSDAEEAEKPPEEEKAADDAWDKYKALAAGQYKEPEEAEDEDSPKPELKHVEEPASATGLAGILEQYNKNKTQRSQMHTIRMKPPEETKHLDLSEDEEKEDKTKTAKDEPSEEDEPKGKKKSGG